MYLIIGFRFKIGKKLHTIEAMAVHLDSDYAGHNKRSDQLQWLYSKTRLEDTICIMGDYNFHMDNEDKFFEDAGTKCFTGSEYSILYESL